MTKGTQASVKVSAKEDGVPKTKTILVSAQPDADEERVEKIAKSHYKASYIDSDVDLEEIEVKEITYR